MSPRITTTIGCALLMLSFGCNGSALESDSTEAIAGAYIGNLTYYVSVPPRDYGHYFVRAVNAKATRCADGEMHPVCAVDVIDYTNVPVNEDTADAHMKEFLAYRAAGYGWIKRVFDEDTGFMVDTLFFEEAWLNPTPNKLRGPLYDVFFEDIRCIRAPCPQYVANVANMTDEILLDGVELESSKAEPGALEEGESQLAESHILISGEIEVIGDQLPEARKPLPGSKILWAETFYIQLMDESEPR